MVSGMQHCEGGPGPDSFGQDTTMSADDARHNARIALEEWVEKGAAPSEVIAAKQDPGAPASRPKATRPLCPYPQFAKYKGTGDANDASSFACAPPSP
jgi:feruloyl esterase